MGYFTESMLRVYAGASLSYQEKTLIKESRVQAMLTIFLSHSHHDRDLVRGLINFLAKQGISVYVDWNDSSMPRITDRETADRIKAKIKENTLFMLLATNNALESRWVPWETGVADQSKGYDRILLIPVADPSGQFKGSEYLQLYRRLEPTFGDWGEVIEPGPSRRSRSAAAFLQEKALQA
jgi:hypothetical protein